jgi:hypothetical protein
LHKRITILAIKRLRFVTDRKSYIILRESWCHIIVLKIHAKTEVRTVDMKDSISEEFVFIFNKCSKFHMKMLLGNFNAKESREDAVKLTIGNENLPKISKDNGVRVVSS